MLLVVDMPVSVPGFCPGPADIFNKLTFMDTSALLKCFVSGNMGVHKGSSTIF